MLPHGGDAIIDDLIGDGADFHPRGAAHAPPANISSKHGLTLYVWSYGTQALKWSDKKRVGETRFTDDVNQTQRSKPVENPGIAARFTAILAR